FKQTHSKIEQHGILPKNTYNLDEKGFLIGCLQKQRRIFNREAYKQGKLIGAGQDGNRDWITVLAGICMDGTVLPAGLIYSADTFNIQDSWLEGFNPKEDTTFFASSSSGWTNEELGVEWLINIFDRFTKQKAQKGRDPRLLFVDGHNSHLSMAFLDYCLKHRIHIAKFPPYSTHQLQPLDVSLFGPLAT
ncbi:CENP-B protein, partial [Viridothelium virens]